MQRAAQLIRTSKLTGGLFSDEDLVRAVWPSAVGKAIAKHTSRLKVVRSVLVVEVEDDLWRRQLYALRSQILARLQKLTASDGIQEIEFRIAIPRREAQRVEVQAAPRWVKTGSES